MNTVYSLINPIDNSIFYVGVTNQPYKRYYSHLKEKKNEEKYSLIKSIRSSGYRLIMNTLKEVECRELADFIEGEYIDLYKFNGVKLLNRNNGGNKPPSQSGKKYTEEQKLNFFVKSTLKKTVYQLDKQGNKIAEFNGVREACRLTGIDHRSISQVASGSKIRKSAGGFKWVYKS
jgi:hypothetical protein